MEEIAVHYSSIHLFHRPDGSLIKSVTDDLKENGPMTLLHSMGVRPLLVVLSLAVFLGGTTLVFGIWHPFGPTVRKQTGGQGEAVIKAGDLLHSDLNARGFGSVGDDVVDLHGNIFNTHNDEVHVAGLTVPEAEEAVNQSQADVDTIALHITIKRHNMIHVFVMGAQNTKVNGFLFLPRNARLSDALFAAKPLPGSDLKMVEVWQPSEQCLRANYAAFLTHKDPTGNPILQNGTLIVIGPIYVRSPS